MPIRRKEDIKMATPNLKNSGTVIGRTTREVKIFENSDGSHKAVLTVAARDNFRTKGQYESQFVPLEAFIPKDSKLLAVFQGIKKGHMIGATYAVTTPAPYEKDGVMQYPVVLQIQSIDTTLESKNVRDEREDKRDLAAAAASTEGDLDA